MRMPRSPSTCTSTPLAPPRFGAFDTPAATAAAAVAVISAAMDWRSSPDARAAAFAYLESVRLLSPPFLVPLALALALARARFLFGLVFVATLAAS
jgi:hypothetical protein